MQTKHEYRALCCSLILTVGLTTSAAFAVGGGGSGIRGGRSGGGGFWGSGFKAGGNGLDDWLLALVIAITGAVSLWAIISIQRRLVTVLLLMKNGDHYASRLCHILQKSEFSDELERGKALARVLAVLNPRDIELGYSRQISRSSNIDKLSKRARRSWDKQNQLANREPSIFAFASVQELGHFTETPERKTENDPDWCLIALTISVSANHFWPRGETQAAKKALNTLKQQAPAPDVLYIFYTPEANETLTRAEANTLFVKLRTHSHPFL